MLTIIMTKRVTFKLTDYILDLLFPKHCLGCGSEGFYICEKCSQELEINKFGNCYICGKRSLENRVCDACRPKTKLDGLLVAGNWENEVLRQAIYQYKYKFIQDLKEELSQTLIKFIKKNNKRLINIDNIILVPVPLHKKRFFWRGFNQAELLAKELGEHFNWPVENFLQKTRHTLPQVEIRSQKERYKNTEGAFLFNATKTVNLKDKTVILIDDVCTTGSTLEECAKVLKPLKPKEIWGLVLARG